MDLRSLTARARTLVSDLAHPESPTDTLGKLGLLRDVQAVPHGAGFVIEVTLNGVECASFEQIKDDILAELDAHDIPARLRTPPQ